MVPPFPVGKVHSERSVLGRRDALHLPAVMVKSPRIIRVSGFKQWVRFSNTEMTEVIPTEIQSLADGVIDPFLMADVFPGEMFWVLVDPRKVGEVTHRFDLKDMAPAISTPPTPEPEPAKKEPEPEEEDDYDDGCRGCYDDAPDEDYDDGCRGCDY